MTQFMKASPYKAFSWIARESLSHCHSIYFQLKTAIVWLALVTVTRRAVGANIVDYVMFLGSSGLKRLHEVKETPEKRGEFVEN